MADNEIVKLMTVGDEVITGDILLAYKVIEVDRQALNPRRELYTKSSIKSRLNMRDFMENLRASGVNTGGPPPLNQADKQLRKSFG